METRNNTGAIFKNDNKKAENHPDYKGKVNVNGKDMERLKTIEEQAILDSDRSNIKLMLDTSTDRLLGIVDEIKEYVENLNHKTNA